MQELPSKLSKLDRGLNCLVLIFIAYSLIYLQACGESTRNDDFALEREIPALALNFEEDRFFIQWEAPLALEIEPDKFIGYHLWVVTDEDNNEAFLEDDVPSSDDLKNYSKDSWDQGILYYNLTDLGSDINIWDVPEDLISEARDQGSITLVFLIWAEFEGGKKSTRIPARMYLQDVFPADLVQADLEIGADSVVLSWTRPSDLVSRVPGRDNGQIFGYNVKLTNSESGGTVTSIGRIEVDTANFSLPDHKISGLKGASYRLDQAIVTKNDLTPLQDADPLFEGRKVEAEINLAILDGGRRGEADSVFQIAFKGLTPKLAYVIQISSLDSLGNALDQQSEAFVSPATFEFRTTDTTQPFFPSDTLIVESEIADTLIGDTPILYTLPNGIFRLDTVMDDPSRRVLMFPEAKDGQTGIERYFIRQIDSSNFGIDTLEFELTRSQAEDSIILLDGGSNQSFLYDTLNYFIPGHNITIELSALDSSGFLSETLQSTIQVPRQLSELCPESGMVALTDIEGGIYCIDQFERRKGQNSTPGEFVNDIRAVDAEAFCDSRGVKSNESGTWEFGLCSAGEWVRACQGVAAVDSLTYGIVEIGSTSEVEGMLFSECNVGTLDSNAAKSSQFESRSSKCVTEDGVYDLPGQLQEWVKSNNGYTLKGSSWASSKNVSLSNLATMSKCVASNVPVRVIPKYVDTLTSLILLTDGAVLLETDSLLEDSLTQLRIEDTLDASYYRDRVMIFKVSDHGETLVEEFPVDYEEYRRDSTRFKNVYFNGLDVELVREVNQVHIYETSTQEATEFHKDASIGFRCCARLQ